MELQNDIGIIQEKLAILSTEIRLRGKFNMYDIHIVAETFFAELMNLIFGYQLKNINLYEHNAKAIDLIDTENKIIVQVSSDNSRGKVQSSLSGIKEEYKQNNYHFIFISISEEVTKLKEKSFEIPEGIIFDPKNDCLDNKTLITHIESKGIECIKRVCKYLNETIFYSGHKFVVPDFVFPFEDTNNLIARDTAVVKLYNIVKENRVTNLYGFGGSGKTSLINLFVKKYENEFNQKAYIAVNNNIKDEFISKINATIQIIKDEEIISNDDIYKRIITFLEENYKSDKDNLLIIDINNANDINEFCCKLVSNSENETKIYPYGWKYIIVSRNQIDVIVNNLNLDDNESENIAFLKDLFFKNVRKGNHLDFNEKDFANLFNKIYNSPLIVELLGLYLRDHNNYSSFDEISELLDKPRFTEKTWNGIEAFKNKNYSEKEKTIIGFLRNIVDLDNFSKDEQKLLRHFILWPTEYIPRNVITGLLEGIFKTEDDFDEALDNLIERKIIACQKNNNVREYKLHDMVAASLRLQVNVFGAMYQKYVYNINNFWNYAHDVYLPFWKCIGFSLSEYDLRVWIGYRYGVGEYAPENDDYINLLKNVINRFFYYIPYTNMIEVMKQLIKIYISIKEEINKYVTDKEPEKNKILDFLDIIIRGCSLENRSSTVSALKQAHFMWKEFAKTEDTKLWCEAQIFIFEAYECEDLKQFTEAEKKYKKAIKIREKQLKNITKTDSGNKSNWFEYQKDIADWYNKLAKLEAYNLKKYQIAQKYYKKAIENIEKILNNKENTFDYNLNVTFTFANTYFNYANLLVSQFGDETSAKENADKAIKLYENNSIDSTTKQDTYAVILVRLADLQQYYLKEHKSAEENYTKALEILKKYPKNTEDYQIFVANTYQSLANLQQYHLK